jgi:hypothetical protein
VKGNGRLEVKGITGCTNEKRKGVKKEASGQNSVYV